MPSHAEHVAVLVQLHAYYEVPVRRRAYLQPPADGAVVQALAYAQQQLRELPLLAAKARCHSLYIEAVSAVHDQGAYEVVVALYRDACAQLRALEKQRS